MEPLLLREEDEKIRLLCMRFINVDIDDYAKHQLLKNPWVPLKFYELSYSTKTEKGSERRQYLRHFHLRMYGWVVYSPSLGGMDIPLTVFAFCIS
ncbi:unnamed protein product [Gongylonema pulchrum]|uniref:FERM domain-containing protein n=1 Tax=Gongylonema pulchrum TaxID=637853 RepID=A0A183DNH8_9BILA|nr:unnamed protein product [Gongylonema pulchrum]